jgi:DNA-binding transcriptional ArsR family regulator
MELEHPAVEDLDLPALLFALSDPARLTIARQIAQAGETGEEVTCQSVGLDMPKSTRSHHLKVLREAGVVHTVVRGRERVMTLRRDDVESRWPGLLAAVLADESLVH